MNTIIKTRNRLKQTLAGLGVLVLIIAGVFIFWQVQKQQETRGRASTVSWLTAQTATVSCGSNGTAVINYTFTNTEPNRSMIVTLNDTQSSASANLDLVAPGITRTGSLDTNVASLSAGKVVFHLSWADDQSQSDDIPFSYSGVSCAGGNGAPVCTDVSQSVCSWDQLPGVSQYHVSVVDVDSGQIVKSGTVASPDAQFVFPSAAGKTYQCSVSAENVCGIGDVTKSDKSTCPVPTPTPAVCVPNQSTCTWDALPGVDTYNVKVIDTNTGSTVKSGTVTSPNTSFDFPSLPAETYQCSVTPVNVCGTGPTTKGQPVTCGTPTPTPTGTLTPTPTPTETPTPTPILPTPTGTLTPSPTPTATPTPTNQPTPTPRPTYTPIPTPTPFPTYTPIPTPTLYPTYTPAPTLTPVLIVRQSQPTIIYQPGQTVYVPGQTQYVQTPGKTVYVTPTPTMAATGAVQTTAIAAGVAAILVALGGVVFLIL
jgi:hypothetical protein